MTLPLPASLRANSGRKMAQWPAMFMPRLPSSHHSGTAPNCRRAALASILATPRLLGNRPAGHPIGKSRVAIVGRRGGAHWCTSTSLVGAAFSMDPATPLFLAHRPPCLPIGEAICAIVWISGSCRQDRLHRRQDRHDRHDRRGCWGAATVMDSTAPCLLVCCPGVLRIDSTIEGIHRTNRRWSGWRGRRGTSWRCCGWRRGRHRGWWCGRCCWNGRRQGCCGSGGAPDTNLHATELLLRWGPSCLPCHCSLVAIIQLCGG